MSRSAPIQAAPVNVSQPSATTGVLMRKCACGQHAKAGTKCDKCKEKEDDGPGNSLHRKATGSLHDHEAPPIVHDVLREEGQPLDARTRADMEQRFGHDFASVRVHADTRAADSARSVSALAYTVGQHVVFGANQFAPSTTAGRHLLAHELAHTVQQRGTGARRQNRLMVRDSESADERAADRAADIAVRGGSVARSMPALAASGPMPPASVQRKGGQLSPQQVDAVYLAWIAEIQKSRGIKGWNTAQDQEVRERVKKQVGPGNFAKFVEWENAENDKHWAKAKAEEEKKKEAEEKARNFDPVAEQNKTVAEMWVATETLRKEVVRVEGLAQKLDFGTGVKGTAARIGVGGYTALYGVGGRTVTSVAEHVPMLAVGAAGTAVGIDRAETLLVDEGKAIKQEGEEMGDDVRTAVRVVGGDLQANYEATRPSYNRYWEALTTFSNHRSDYVNKYRHLSGMTLFIERAPHIGGMDKAMKEMREAGNEFLMKCAQLGIETDAKALNKLSSNVVKGAEGLVETAVTGPLMEFAPGIGALKNAMKGAKKVDDPIKKELKKEAKEQVGKQVAKSADEAPVASGAKKADEAAPTSPKDVPPKAVPAADAKALKENVDKARPVTDQEFVDKGYVTEIPIGEHTYRRHKDGAWCRFSTPVCNLKVDPDIDKQVKTVVPDAAPPAAARPKKAPSKKPSKQAPTKAAPDKAAADAGAGKKKKPAKDESPQAKEKRQAKEQKAAQTERDKQILDKQINTLQEQVDEAFKENVDLAGRKVRRDSPEGKEIAEEIALNKQQQATGAKTLEDLRAKRADLEVTPLGKARAYSFSGKADAAVRTRSRGLDEVSGKPIKEPSVDHVVPIDEMVLMKGWDDLDITQQRLILSRLDNLKLMEKPLNSSKGARRWENWPAGKRIYGDVKWQEMVDYERKMRGEIQKQIELFLARPM